MENVSYLDCLLLQAAQLEAERQRQREWEERRKEELLNQKGLEEDIVKGLKLRLDNLKGELTETVRRVSTLNAYIVISSASTFLWLGFLKSSLF